MSLLSTLRSLFSGKKKSGRGAATKKNSSALAKRFEPTDEQRWRGFWEEEGIFRFDPADREREIFSIDTPPPYVSADHLHQGHVMSYAQAEFIARFQRMRGKNVFYPMGFDDNGLPTERFVEKKFAIDKKKTSRPEFVRLCLEETQRGAKTYRELWQALGVSVDWSRTYSTIDATSQTVAQRSFLDLAEKGILERREEPVLWCPTCETALAGADLEDATEKAEMFYLDFELVED
jgi:valyl-tRNA synthetase